jgi:hypothetical protein
MNQFDKTESTGCQQEYVPRRSRCASILVSFEVKARVITEVESAWPLSGLKNLAAQALRVKGDGVMLRAENGFVAQCRRGFFATLTKRRLKRGVLRSLVDLQAAINRFLAEANDNPKPFVWTADPDKIIAAVRRGYQRLDSIHSHVRGFGCNRRGLSDQAAWTGTCRAMGQTKLASSRAIAMVTTLAGLPLRASLG